MQYRLKASSGRNVVFDWARGSKPTLEDVDAIDEQQNGPNFSDVQGGASLGPVDEFSDVRSGASSNRYSGPHPEATIGAPENQRFSGVDYGQNLLSKLGDWVEPFVNHRDFTAQDRIDTIFDPDREPNLLQKSINREEADLIRRNEESKDPGRLLTKEEQSSWFPTFDADLNTPEGRAEYRAIRDTAPLAAMKTVGGVTNIAGLAGGALGNTGVLGRAANALGDVGDVISMAQGAEQIYNHRSPQEVGMGLFQLGLGGASRIAHARGVHEGNVLEAYRDPNMEGSNMAFGDVGPRFDPNRVDPETGLTSKETLEYEKFFNEHENNPKVLDEYDRLRASGASVSDAIRNTTENIIGDREPSLDDIINSAEAKDIYSDIPRKPKDIPTNPFGPEDINNVSIPPPEGPKELEFQPGVQRKSFTGALDAQNADLLDKIRSYQESYPPGFSSIPDGRGGTIVVHAGPNGDVQAFAKLSGGGIGLIGRSEHIPANKSNDPFHPVNKLKNKLGELGVVRSDTDAFSEAGLKSLNKQLPSDTVREAAVRLEQFDNIDELHGAEYPPGHSKEGEKLNTEQIKQGIRDLGADHGREFLPEAQAVAARVKERAGGSDKDVRNFLDEKIKEDIYNEEVTDISEDPLNELVSDKQMSFGEAPKDKSLIKREDQGETKVNPKFQEDYHAPYSETDASYRDLPSEAIYGDYGDEQARLEKRFSVLSDKEFSRYTELNNLLDEYERNPDTFDSSKYGKKEYDEFTALNRKMDLAEKRQEYGYDAENKPPVEHRGKGGDDDFVDDILPGEIVSSNQLLRERTPRAKEDLQRTIEQLKRNRAVEVEPLPKEKSAKTLYDEAVEEIRSGKKPVDIGIKIPEKSKGNVRYTVDENGLPVKVEDLKYKTGKAQIVTTSKQKQVTGAPGKQTASGASQSAQATSQRVTTPNTPTATRGANAGPVPGASSARVSPGGPTAPTNITNRNVAAGGTGGNVPPNKPPRTPKGPKQGPPKPPEPATLTQQIASTLNIPRALKSSYDIGAARQMLFLMNRKGARKGFMEGAKSFFSEANAVKNRDYIHNSPLFERSQDAGLDLTDWDPKAAVGKHEEAFGSKIAGVIPGIRASERAQVTALNRARFEVFNDIADSPRWKGASEEDLKKIAKYVNVFTGRGDIPGGLNKIAPELSILFYSPRMQASHIQKFGYTLQSLAPEKLGGLDPRLRKEVFRDAGSTVGAIASILGLAAMSGYATVETDPRSSDFLQMKVGEKRIDPWGGLRPWAVYFARNGNALMRKLGAATESMEKGDIKTTTGKFSKLGKTSSPYSEDALDLAGRFARSKLSPAAGLAVDYLKGSDVTGKKFGPGTVASTFTPMSFEDAKELADDGSVENAALWLMSLTGGININVHEKADRKKPKSLSDVFVPSKFLKRHDLLGEVGPVQ